MGLASRERRARDSPASGRAVSKRARARGEFPCDGFGGSVGDHVGEVGEALRGGDSDGLDEAEPSGPVVLIPGEFLAYSGEEFEMGDGLGGVADSGIDEAEGFVDECVAGGEGVDGGESGHAGGLEVGSEAEEEGGREGGFFSGAEEGGGGAARWCRRGGPGNAPMWLQPVGARR